MRVQLTALKATELFLDPFTGRILGSRERGALHLDRAHLVPFLYRLHYTLYVPGDWGEWFMGTVALVWLADCFVGLYLPMPLRTGAHLLRILDGSWWHRWRPAWRLKPGASPTRLTFDLHRAGGLWLWVVLLILAFSAVYFNLTRQVFDPVVRLFTRVSPTPSEFLPQLPDASSRPRLSFADALEAGRRSLTPASRQMIPYYIGQFADASGIYKVVFIDQGRGDRAWRFHYETEYIDGTSGQLAMRVGYHVGTAGDRFSLWQYPLHTGQIFGFWGRVFIALTGLIVAMLSATGILLWLKKRRAQRYALRHVMRQRAATSAGTPGSRPSRLVGGIAFLGVALSGFVPVHAADLDSSDDGTLQEISITAQRIHDVNLSQPDSTASRLGLSSLDTPASVQVISGEAIQLRGDMDVNDPVTRAAGFTTAATLGNGGGGLSARGFVGVGSVMVPYDGIQMPVAANTVTFPYDTWNIDRIETLSGPASV